MSSTQFAAGRNRDKKATLVESIRDSLNDLNLEAVLRHQTRGAQIVDVRDSAKFGSTHLIGAINIGLRGRFAVWAGALLQANRPVIVVADDGDETEALFRLRKLGFTVIGFLRHGISAATSDSALLSSLERVPVTDAAEQLDRVGPPLLLDVRSSAERAEYIPGSWHVSLCNLVDKVRGIPRTRPLIVYCVDGYRSAIACSLLKKLGYRDVKDLAGGLNAWKASGLPTEAEDTSGT